MENEYLRSLRKSTGETQLQLAILLGLKTASAYSKKENGKVPFTVEEAKILAEHFKEPLEKICSL